MTKARVGRPRGENTENANRRRKQLMDAAIESIVEFGLPATTLAKVAKVSGLSQGTAVFYFKSKDTLLYETFRYRLNEFKVFWTEALASAEPDPVDRLLTMAFAMVDPRIMTPQNLKFWNAFWNEACTKESLAKISEDFENERLKTQADLCEDARDMITGANWTPATVAHTLEAVAEGLWVRLYYSPGYMSVMDARIVMGTVVATIFPTRSEEIMNLASNCPDN